jgi:alginate O-acetyltransferase complex protein AlgI
MLFNSLEFCLFFAVVTALYYWLPWRHRWKMLLVASCIFYMAFIPAYIVVLFTTIVIDYYMGMKIAESQGAQRKTYLITSVVATCLVLFAFKYFDFFGETVRELQRSVGHDATFPVANIVLPIGLSFHTFQSLSYVIEVYRGRQAPERNFGIYALYVMFYPQLVAGPIERPQNLLHQFREDHRWDTSNIAQGLWLIAWGYFLKMVIADRVALLVNPTFDHWQTASGGAIALATVAFAVQIYADFAGYSSIAIGCARVMGFTLMTNFRRPYFAASFGEFWKRWHISLSTWFKDYVYIPLGGGRVRQSRIYANLLITFAISGLWHGARWNFVWWGVYNGLLLIAEHALESAGARWPKGVVFGAMRRGVVLALICVGWIFFRAESLRAALHMLRALALSAVSTLFDVPHWWAALAGSSTLQPAVWMTIVLTVFAFAMDGLAEHRKEDALQWNGRLRNIAVATVVMCDAVLLFGVLRPSAFIYFQF